MGGSEVLVIESNQNHAVIKDTEVCPTLTASMGLGGGHIPMILEPIVFRDDITIKVDEGGVAFTLGARDFKGVQCVVQNVTGTLSPGAHAGSYNGQDAYNDMLVVEDGERICSSEVRNIQGITGCVNSETEGLQGCDRYYSEGGVANE